MLKGEVVSAVERSEVSERKLKPEGFKNASPARRSRWRGRCRNDGSASPTELRQRGAEKKESDGL